jgi:hypothetical protein
VVIRTEWFVRGLVESIFVVGSIARLAGCT